MKKTLLVLLMLLSACSSSRAPNSGTQAPGINGSEVNAPTTVGSADLGGTEVGNGSDEQNDKENRDIAWFLGVDKTIHACLDISSDFGVDRATASKVIADAFAKWPEYIARKQAYEQYSRADEMKPSTKLELSPEPCKGGEDLRFAFGVTNSSIEKAKTAYENPTAFARRTSYDPNEGWGRGFIWVKSSAGTLPSDYPNWKIPYVLNVILLHELGHVFGCGHVEGTIMDEDISLQLRGQTSSRAMATEPDAIATPEKSEVSAKNMYSIDARLALVMCQDCPRQAMGYELNPSINPGLEVLTGEYPSDDAKCWVDSFIPSKTHLTLKCQNNGRKYSYELEGEQFAQEMTRYEYVFNAYKLRPEYPIHTGDRASVRSVHGLSWKGYLIVDKKKKFAVTVSIDGSDEGDFDISEIVDGVTFIIGRVKIKKDSTEKSSPSSNPN